MHATRRVFAHIMSELIGYARVSSTSCSDSRTSAALLKNIMPAQLTIAENSAGVLLTFGKNVLRLW